MPKYRNILANSAHLTLSTEDGDLHIEYHPKRISQALIAKFQDLDTSARQNMKNNEKILPIFLEINKIFVELVKEWDMLDEKGCGECDECKLGEEENCQQKIEFMFVLDPENLLRLPIETIQDVTAAIFEDRNPNRKAPQKRN